MVEEVGGKTLEASFRGKVCLDDGGSFSSSWVRRRRGWVIGVGGSLASLRRYVVVNIQDFVILRKRRHGEEFIIVHLRGPKSRVVPL